VPSSWRRSPTLGNPPAPRKGYASQFYDVTDSVLIYGSCAANTRLATGSYVPEIGTASVDSDATVLAKSGTQITQKSSAGPTIFDDDANTYYEITQIGYSAVNITFDTAVQVSSLSIAWSPNIASQFSIKTSTEKCDAVTNFTTLQSYSSNTDNVTVVQGILKRAVRIRCVQIWVRRENRQTQAPTIAEVNLQGCLYTGYWAQVKQANASPLGRAFASMSLETPRLWIFGGQLLDGFSNEVLVFDLETNTWTAPLIDDDNKPLPRHSHCSITYTDLNQTTWLIVVGGIGYRNELISMGDAWALQLSPRPAAGRQWQQISTTSTVPGPIATPVCALFNNTMLVWGAAKTSNTGA